MSSNKKPHLMSAMPEREGTPTQPPRPEGDEPPHLAAGIEPEGDNRRPTSSNINIPNNNDNAATAPAALNRNEPVDKAEVDSNCPAEEENPKFFDSSDEGLPWYDPFALRRRVCGFGSSDEYDEVCAKYRFKVFAYIDYFFSISDRRSSYSTELFGGLCTFFAMAYIMVLNPIIVGGAIGMEWAQGLFFATTLASGIFTLLMGVLVNLPIALAPGMGLNGYFASVTRTVRSDGGALILIGGLTYKEGFAAIFMSGLIYLVVTYSGLRYFLFISVPDGLRHAISAGIGLFICIIGAKVAHVMSIDYFGGNITGPAEIPFYTYEIKQVAPRDSDAARMTILGLVFVSIFITLKFRAGILISIILTTLCSIRGDGTGPDSVTNLGVWKQDPIPFIAKTDSLLFGKLDFGIIGTTRFWEVVWTMFFVDMFDSFGTVGAIMLRLGIRSHNKNEERVITNAMKVDGFGTLVGSVMGATSVTMYIESLTGVACGARTGMASLITGVLFFLSLLFVYPFVAIIPNSATMPALFMVGAYSIESIRHIDLDDMPTCISAFMTIATMPFTYSIANGIAAGFIFYNLCVITRWLDYRRRTLQEHGCASRTIPPNRDSTKWFWQEGWNLDHRKDFLPHPGMVLMGIFMVLRYVFFF